MRQGSYERLYELESTPEALAESIAFISDKIKAIVKKQETVLICFPDKGPISLGNILGEAVRACGAKPLFWGPDFRWKELLRLAFQYRIQTIFGHPLIIYGVTKLARATMTPLYIRNVVLSGHSHVKWMEQGLKKGLDCNVWGCYAIKCGPIIAGFTCSQDAGIHVRDTLFDAVIVDEQGDPLADSQRGRLILTYKKDPVVRIAPEENSVLHHQPCSCGSDAPRMVEIGRPIFGSSSDGLLEEHFLEWSSILDYRAKQTESGIDLELVVFPGEPLPRLPSCARLLVRAWNPEVDIPFFIVDNFMKIPEKA